MKKIYLNKQTFGWATILISGLGLLASCGSYQNNSYYNNDGIYNSSPEHSYSQRVRVGSTQSVDPNYDYNKYENYFAEAKSDYTVFTNTDEFTTETATPAYNNSGYVDYTQNQTYSERYGSFGQNSSNVTVNVYSDYGFGYNPYWGWNGYYGSYWGWRNPYVGIYFGTPYYYNNWYGPSWGYNYHPGYYYSGGYYGNNYYAPYRPAVVRANGQRTGVVRNNNVANPNSPNRVGVVRNPNNTSGTNAVNRGSGSGVDRVTTIRDNGVTRQAVLRDPNTINRAATQNASNAIRNNSTTIYNRNNQNANSGSYNINRNSNSNTRINSSTREAASRAVQRTQSNQSSINRSSSAPTRSYSPPSSTSRGGNIGGGSVSRGGASGVRR